METLGGENFGTGATLKIELRAVYSRGALFLVVLQIL